MRISIEGGPGADQRIGGRAPGIERAARHGGLAGGAGRGHAGCHLQPQWNEGIRDVAAAAIARVEYRHPDAVVVHDRVIVRIRECHRRRNAGRIEAAFARQVTQRSHGARGIGAAQPGTQRRVFIQQCLDSRDGLQLVAAQRPASGPAESAQGSHEARGPLGRAALRALDLCRCFTQSRHQCRGGIASLALQEIRQRRRGVFQPASLAQRRLDDGACEYVVAIQERHAQPQHQLVEAQRAHQQSQRQQRMRHQRKIGEGLPAFDDEQRRELARLHVHPFAGCEGLRQQAFVLPPALPQPGVHDQQSFAAILFQLLAAPAADELEFMVIVARRGDGNRGRRRAGCHRARAEPAQRFLRQRRKPHQTGAMQFGGRRQLTQPGAQRLAAELA
jgi:hypothetical protein